MTLQRTSNCCHGVRKRTGTALLFTTINQCAVIRTTWEIACRSLTFATKFDFTSFHCRKSCFFYLRCWALVKIVRRIKNKLLLTQTTMANKITNEQFFTSLFPKIYEHLISRMSRHLSFYKYSINILELSGMTCKNL